MKQFVIFRKRLPSLAKGSITVIIVSAWLNIHKLSQWVRQLYRKIQPKARKTGNPERKKSWNGKNSHTVANQKLTIQIIKFQIVLQLQQLYSQVIFRKYFIKSCSPDPTTNYESWIFTYFSVLNQLDCVFLMTKINKNRNRNHKICSDWSHNLWKFLICCFGIGVSGEQIRR